MPSQPHGSVISVMLAVEDTPKAIEWYKRASGPQYCGTSAQLPELRSVVSVLLGPAGCERMGKPYEARRHFGESGIIL